MYAPKIDPFFTKLMLDHPDITIYEACIKSKLQACRHNVCVNNIHTIMNGVTIKKLLEDKKLTLHAAYAHFADYKTFEKEELDIPKPKPILRRLMLDHPTLKIGAGCMESEPCCHKISEDDGVTWILLDGCQIRKLLVSMNLTSHSSYAHFKEYDGFDGFGLFD